ncbi:MULTISPECIES: dihydrofolate reductase family protein [unclassified Myxococcus]|uniref:dihydrofolate reductase family protein n=1 Tax=unclassified Myxococcus TaxID=2648731 RepID=UPI001CC19ADC|nr:MULTISPECIES: dihydrofolate reductase family protein [unclassified Myxococcus]MBZ4395986.1 dihydrofolate reductase family protein [Myxococcus sp. AS-1-15]MBZ4408905.1 dihydrofolate reductase family protein [Myxococcus sp. XM-1-1-1]BDT37476.1 dihydrofolate reductase family protein [Myxococcus sp. MH1]
MQSQTRKLTYHVATTLDGYIAREDDSFDCFVFEGDHATEYMATLRHDYDTVLMGRRTYDVGLKFKVTDPYPYLETFVVSRSMKEAPNPRVKLISDDVVGAVRALKAKEGKGIYLSGGGALATQLFAAGLVDEVLVKLNPRLLGSGIPLVSRLDRHLELALRSTKVYQNGVVLLRYDVQR